MPETLYIGSDINTAETKVLFGEQDFVDAVAKYMGQQAREHLENILEDKYEDGYRKGYEDGHQVGYNCGYDFGRPE